MNKIYCKEKLNRQSKKKFLLDYFLKDAPETYNDPECSIRQCSSRRSRSIIDLKFLLDGHFKTTTEINDVIIMMLDHVLDGTDRLRCLRCNNINKLVFYRSSLHPSYYTFNLSEYDSIRCGDGYSWNDFKQIYLNKTK
jgi:hypothetical protein